MSGSKLVFTIFLIIILSLGGLLGFYFYLNRTSTLDQAPVAGTKPTFTGFDQVTLDNPQNNKNRVDLGSYTTPTSTVATSTIVIAKPAEEELLRLISAQPVAGHDFIIREVDISTSSTPIGTSSAAIKLAQKNKKLVPMEFIRFILKATGNVFETGTSSTSTNDRLTNKTIPKLQEAFFNSKGDGVIIRNVLGNDGIQTRYLSLKPDQIQGTSTIQNVSTTDLALNITQMAPSPDKTKLFYTRNTGDRGTVSNWDGGGKTTLFNSPFREWLPQWMTTGNLLLNTKPSGLTAGYLYNIDTKTGTVKKVIGGGLGLTSLGSTDGQKILYTTTEDNRLKMNIYDVKESFSWVLPAETLPEKCVWGNKYKSIVYCAIPKVVSNNHAYPDDWYLGLVHFSDVIWKMDLTTARNTVIVDPEKQTSFPLDITNMKLSKNDDYLTFVDKNTYSLWGIKLKTPVVATTTAPIKIKR